MYIMNVGYVYDDARRLCRWMGDGGGVCRRGLGGGGGY